MNHGLNPLSIGERFRTWACPRLMPRQSRLNPISIGERFRTGGNWREWNDLAVLIPSVSGSGSGHYIIDNTAERRRGLNPLSIGERFRTQGQH